LSVGASSKFPQWLASGRVKLDSDVSHHGATSEIKRPGPGIGIALVGNEGHLALVERQAVAGRGEVLIETVI
jgi:hypothetical protein